jgi:hypothetical protein
MDLWRVVDPLELQSIAQTGCFSGSPVGSEHKYFWGSAEDAVQYARKVNGRWGYTPPTIVHTQTPRSIVEGPQRMDGMPGYTVRNENLILLTPPDVTGLWPP